MIIGFFPPSTDAELRTDDGTIEGLAHLRFAIEDAVKCVAEDGKIVDAAIVLTNELIVQQGSGRRRIPLARRWPESAGAYLLAPGKDPRAVYVRDYPSTFGITLIPEAAVYFGAETCRRK